MSGADQEETGDRMEPKVSVVTPCYNGEKYLRGYLQSLLDQTYRNLEIILVDDGSEDGSAQMMEEFRPLFEQKGMTFRYLYQSHRNQSVALNNGLKYVTGEYLVWPDSDDVLAPESIEKRVKYLQEHPQKGMVRSDVYFIRSGVRVPCSKKKYVRDDQENLFYDLFFERCPVYCGAFMIRMRFFDEIIPDREIELGSGGQNYQMLFPMAFYYRCGYIGEALYGIMIHEDSHSRKARSYEQARERMDSLLTICQGTLTKLPMDVREKTFLMKMKKNQCYRYLDKQYRRSICFLGRSVGRCFYLWKYHRYKGNHNNE